MHVTFLPAGVDIFTAPTPFPHYAALLYPLPHEEKMMMTMMNAIMGIMNMVMMVMLDAAIETD